MSHDLIPRNERVNAELHYNFSGWQWMFQFCKRNKVDVRSFDGLNDGRLIPASVCKAIADVIDANRDEYNKAFAGESYGPDPATEHAKAWRESGGVEQW